MNPHQPGTEPAPPLPSYFALWSKYEEVTMHFNDLIIRLRFQALAGVAGISALVGVLGRDMAPALRSKAVGGIFLLLLFFWIAIWLLDRLYYDKLLTGAVSALLKIERESEQGGMPKQIDLSTIIEKSFVGDPLEIRRAPAFTDGRNWFYVLVLLTLLAGSLMHFFNFNL